LSRLKPIWWRLLVGLDNLANVLLSLIPALQRKGFGYVDESISSVVGKAYYHHQDRSWFILAIYHPIEWLDPGHFLRNIEFDEGVSVG